MHYCVKQNLIVVSTEKNDAERCIPTMKGCRKKSKCHFPALERSILKVTYTNQTPIYPPTVMKKYVTSLPWNKSVI